MIHHCRVAFVVESGVTEGDKGYDSPYAKFLEKEIDAISWVLGQLILDHGEHKPIKQWLDAVEEWLGDDWHVDLSDEDQKRLDAIKGWTYE